MCLETSLVFSCDFCAIFQNQATKFGQLIKRDKYFSPKIMLKMGSGNFTKDISKWLKLQVSSPETGVKRDSSTGIFLWISHIFSKNLIYRTLLDDCLCWFLCSNLGFITLLWSDFFRLFLHVFPFIIDIVGKGIPAPLFLKAPIPWPSLPPVLKSLLALLSFLLHPILRYFR